MCRQVLSEEVGRRDGSRLPAVLSSLPWLLTRYQAALKRQALARAREAPLSTHKERHKGAAPASADFHFFAALLQPVLAGLNSVWQVHALTLRCI